MYPSEGAGQLRIAEAHGGYQWERARERVRPRQPREREREKRRRGGRRVAPEGRWAMSLSSLVLSFLVMFSLWLTNLTHTPAACNNIFNETECLGAGCEFANQFCSPPGRCDCRRAPTAIGHCFSCLESSVVFFSLLVFSLVLLVSLAVSFFPVAVSFFPLTSRCPVLSSCCLVLSSCCVAFAFVSFSFASSLICCRGSLDVVR